MHELRTPLTAVILRVHLLRRRLRRGDEITSVDGDLERIEATLNQIATVIARIDDAARHER